MPILGSGGPYPTIEQIMNLVRVHLNDTFAGATSTVGEGRIFVDTWTPSLTILNSAIRKLLRDLEELGIPTSVMPQDTFILNLPVINGPQGSGVDDPTVQVYLSFAGFWDGTVLHSAFTLPSNLLMPIWVKQRQSGTNTTFAPFPEAKDGLPSAYQDATLGSWQWRGDSIFMNGSVQPCDIELYYSATTVAIPTNLPPSQFSMTTVQIMDSIDALSWYMAYLFSRPRAPVQAKPLVDDLMANYVAEKETMANRYTLQRQRSPITRVAFGTSEGPFSGWGPQP